MGQELGQAWGTQQSVLQSLKGCERWRDRKEQALEQLWFFVFFFYFIQLNARAPTAHTLAPFGTQNPPKGGWGPMAKPKQRWMPPIPSVGVLGQLIGAGPHRFPPFMWERGTEMAAQAAFGWVASAGGRLGKAVCSAGLAAARHPASGCRILKDGERGVWVRSSCGGLWLRWAGGFPLNAAEGNQVPREAGLPRAGAVGCLPQQTFVHQLN